MKTPQFIEVFNSTILIRIKDIKVFMIYIYIAMNEEEIFLVDDFHFVYISCIFEPKSITSYFSYIYIFSIFIAKYGNSKILFILLVWMY